MKRGFVTMATGGDQFYRIALNLLKSYKFFTTEPLSFAIICDRKNSYTEAFDDVIILENATCTYIDKISLLKLVPYDETIFIDADCLAYGDLNILFEKFAGADDISCFGKVLPLDSKNGFFKREDIGKYANEISYCIGIHGGIMFFRKSEVLNKIYDKCNEIKDHYYEYKFRYFKDPADEPLIALSMALYGLRPVDSLCPMFAYYPVDVKFLRFDILNAKATFKVDNVKYNILIVHFSSRVTKEKVYSIEEYNLNLLCDGKTSKKSARALFKPYKWSLFADNVRKKKDLCVYNLKCTLKPIIVKILHLK